MNKSNTVCFVAGRSGGHLIPALTLAHKAQTENRQTKILFFSTSTKLDKKITETAQNIDWHVPLTLENVPYKKIYRYPIFFWHFFQSLFIALRQLRKKKPSVVISTGGYIALPVCFAAKMLGIPIELFELNVVPGKTTRFLSPVARTIHLCFEKTKRLLSAQKCKLSNYPNRFSCPTDNQPSREHMLKKIGFSPEKKTVLVLGGSQGSLFINNLIKQWISHEHDLHNTVQVIHQIGTFDDTDWPALYKKMHVGALVFDFCNDLATYYPVADLVICRSGAGSLFETMFFKKQCITIPLETKTNTHQVHNALAMQQLHPTLVTVLRKKELLSNQKLFANTIEHTLPISSLSAKSLLDK